MVSIFFFGTRCGPGLVNKTDKKSLIKKHFWSTVFMLFIIDHGSCSRVHAALICSLFQIMVPVLEYMLLLSVLYYRSWFLFSSTCCSYLFSILDHGSCSRVHAALICFIFEIMVPVLEYMLLLSVLYSRSWFLFSSTCCCYLFYILDHCSGSRVHTALICSIFQIMVPVLEFMLLLSGINIWKEAFQWTWAAVSAVIYYPHLQKQKFICKKLLTAFLSDPSIFHIFGLLWYFTIPLDAYTNISTSLQYLSFHYFPFSVI